MAPGKHEPMLVKEFEFYLANQAEMVEKYDGKVIVIQGENVLGVYDSYPDAVMETQRLHELGTFLVQRVSEGDAEYTRQFHSCVVFP